jgi:exosortase/archaeosortase family protein
VVTKPKLILNDNLKAAVPLLTRTAAFLTLFVVLSGIIGPRIISHGLVNKDGFQIYGGAGKSLLFGVLALALLINKRDALPKLKAWKIYQIFWLVSSVLTLVLAWISVDHLINNSSSLSWILLAHLSIIGSVILAAGATFGLANLRVLARKYRREIYISIGLSIVFFIFLYIVYGLWALLATVVLHAVSWLLRLSGLTVIIALPRTLVLTKFSVTIAEYCSGIESIALFTALYTLIGVLDWRRFNHKKYLWIFPEALLLLFGFNILRVFGLILAGYYINPQIAFSLFHTYAGMIFFILYSILFWGISYKWMLQKR